MLNDLSQSTSSCSDRGINSPVTIWFIPSTAATDEKAQQLPSFKKQPNYVNRHPSKAFTKTILRDKKVTWKTSFERKVSNTFSDVIDGHQQIIRDEAKLIIADKSYDQG